jgi:RHS repeat-associated protein
VQKVEPPGGGGTEVWKYTWDVLDQLRSVTRPDGSVWEYKYDALGRRIEKKGPTETIRFVWNGDTLVHEIRLEKEQWSGWIFSEGDLTPIAKAEGRRFYSIVTDRLGTPCEMLDTRGGVAWRRTGRAYGGELSAEGNGVENPFRFPGQYYDAESGLCYNRFRYYDPECGRYVQQDPLGIFVSNNLYQYAPNPISWIDPFGLTKAACHKSGDRGKHKALKDLKEGYDFLADEVTMTVQGKGGNVRFRADIVARNKETNEIHVFEVKNGTGRLTTNQEKANVFDMNNPSNRNGTISPEGAQKTMTVATSNPSKLKGLGMKRGEKRLVTFGVLHYDGEPGSRVQ